MERYEEHGVDTHAIVRASMIGFMEGALIHGIFHGDSTAAISTFAPTANRPA